MQRSQPLCRQTSKLVLRASRQDVRCQQGMLASVRKVSTQPLAQSRNLWFRRTIDSPPTSKSWCRNFTSHKTDVVFPDPNRPDLFYHLVNPPTPLSSSLPAFALSFLDTAPPSVNSPTVIGWLPAQTHANDASGPSQSQQKVAVLQDFVGNRKEGSLLDPSVC